MNGLRAIDLCCGAGGWACAARGLPITITHAFDRWPDACETYRLNQPQTSVVCGDLLDPAIQEQVRALAGRVDLVLGGIPCEQITPYRRCWNNSKTGVTPPELAAFQSLLDACLSLVRHLAPRWWCLEDVAAVMKHAPPLTPYRQIDAGDYSAQRRRRVCLGEFPEPAPSLSQDTAGKHLRPGPFRIGPRASRVSPRTTSSSVRRPPSGR